jgi:hypothetical protein
MKKTILVPDNILSKVKDYTERNGMTFTQAVIIGLNKLVDSEQLQKQLQQELVSMMHDPLVIDLIKEKLNEQKS